MINRKSFIVGIKGTRLNNQEREFLLRYKPWGIILFSRNLENIKQIQKLTKDIKKIFNDEKYPILIDQEGGRINRLKKIISLENFTSEHFGKIYIKNIKEFNEYIDHTSKIAKAEGLTAHAIAAEKRFKN